LKGIQQKSLVGRTTKVRKVLLIPSCWCLSS